MPTTNFVNGTRITAEWLNEVDAAVFAPDDSDIYDVRYYGAVLDGVTDDLAAFNAAIAAIPSGGSREIKVPGIAYLSSATTNGGRFPQFIFPPGCGITTTPGGVVGGETSRLSWPIRLERKLTNGYLYDYSTNPPAGNSSIRHRYTNISGNKGTLGTANAYGTRTDYKSWAYGSGFDIAEATIGIWNRSANEDGGQQLASWIVAVSPVIGEDSGTPSSTRWGTFACEMNVVNRYKDTGWSAKRSPVNNWTGVLQIVPESDEFEVVGTTTFNVLYGIVIGCSSDNKDDGIPAQMWNGFLMEPNAICGDGYGAYWSGNDTGTAGRDPAAAMALAQTWKTGINTQAATFTTGRALAVGADQRISWVDGSGNELAGIRSGTGTPEGVVTAPIGSMFLRRDGGAGTTMYVKESGTGNTGWVGK